VSVHEFAPGLEEREADVYVVARCVCGWEGNAHPESDDGLEEARLEYIDHEEERHDDRLQPPT
jgi:hypothetical protein